MAIRRSSSADVEALIAALRAGGHDDSRREAALARLAVIGPRAVSHILQALDRADTSDERATLLLALERIPSVRAIEAILGGLDRPADMPDQVVRLASIRAARPLLDLSPGGTLLLEKLTTLVLNADETSIVRCGALEAMSDLPAPSLKPLTQRLADDADAAVRAAAAGLHRSSVRPGSGRAALGRDLPDNPDAVLESIGRSAANAPLSTLHAALKSVREKEAGSGRRGVDWLGVRGAIHLALARRNSRVALYDLREAFEATNAHPLPADFVAAVKLIGDGTCLEPLARAFMRAPALGRRDRAGAWSRQTREAFRDVLARQPPAGRRKVLGRLQQRWPGDEDAARLRELIATGRSLGWRSTQ